jgi:hypothetical protein
MECFFKASVLHDAHTGDRNVSEEQIFLLPEQLHNKTWHWRVFTLLQAWACNHATSFQLCLYQQLWLQRQIFDVLMYSPCNITRPFYCSNINGKSMQRTQMFLKWHALYMCLSLITTIHLWCHSPVPQEELVMNI